MRNEFLGSLRNMKPGQPLSEAYFSREKHEARSLSFWDCFVIVLDGEDEVKHHPATGSIFKIV